MSHSSYSESNSNSDFAPVYQMNDSAVKTLMHKLHEFLWNALMQDNEPQLKIRFDRQGHPWWEVYDPMTDQRITFATEAEVRSWLEHRSLPQVSQS